MFRFYSKPDVKTRVTVVGTFDQNTLKIAVARCSEKDRFSKKAGRSVAEERLQNGQLYLQMSLPKCTATDFIHIAENISYGVIKTKKIILV